MAARPENDYKFWTMFIPKWLAILSLTVFFTGATEAAGLNPVALRCEYRVNPLGIDEAQPRLTWRVESESDERGAKADGLSNPRRFQRGTTRQKFR